MEFLFHKIAIILINSVAIWLGFWVYFTDRKAKANKVFFVIVFLLVTWISSGFICQRLAGSEIVGLFFARLGMISGFLFLVPVYFLIKLFPKEEKSSIWDKVVITLGMILLLLSFSDMVLPGVYRIPGGYLPFIGRGLIVPFGIVILLGIIVISKFIRKYIKGAKKDKIKISYLLIGFTVFVLVNIVFSIYYSFFRNTFAYHYLGEYSAVLLLGLTAYAIIKEKLFGIKFILTYLLVVTMGIILFLLPFLAQGVYMRILLFGVFFLFFIIGYLLIDGTLKEIRQKELLEDKVKERTQELEARTNELERWFRLTVGRELRMKELKEEIKRLRQGQSNKG